MVTDLILSWPRNCDYPLWRQFLRDNRYRFNEVLIGFTETNQGDDYRDFIRQSMFFDYILFANAPTPDARIEEDWRNLSINSLLLHSYNAPWLWFTEQDFYPLKGFWENVKYHKDNGCNVIAVYQADRMHPCCIFMTRNALNKTKKNFGIVKDKYDHFHIIQTDIEDAGLKVGVIDPSTYIHYNGLSHNMTLLATGGQPNYEQDKFAEWLKASLNVAVPLDHRFIQLAGKMR